MKIASSALMGTLLVSPAFGQAAQNPVPTTLPSQTTLPIVFTRSVSADHDHVGDQISAKTIQVVKLPDGTVIPNGSRIVGKVVEATPFNFDKTPYAKQPNSTLTIQFDEVIVANHRVPLKVYVRALADPIASNEARESFGTDDTQATTEQIGGDQVRPGSSEVVSKDGDVVAYTRRDGVYAHLIAHSGNSPKPCDSSSQEVSVDIFSASACGLYGFSGLSAAEVGSSSRPSTLALVSNHRSPKIWQHSTALLEVLPQTIAQR
jgi:hypothetical protein